MMDSVAVGLLYFLHSLTKEVLTWGYLKKISDSYNLQQTDTEVKTIGLHSKKNFPFDEEAHISVLA